MAKIVLMRITVWQLSSKYDDAHPLLHVLAGNFGDEVMFAFAKVKSN